MRRIRPPRRTTSWGAIALVGGLALAGCSGSPTTTSVTTGTTTSARVPASPITTKATAKPTAKATTSPYTAFKGGPVIAAKIDNTSASRPRVGVGQADVVYVEPVEAGLTRLLCVWSTSIPAQIGPVRSGRETDNDLLANWGHPAFAFSGGSAATLATLATGRQINLSNDASQQGFQRAGNRRAPYNVIGYPGLLFQRAGDASPPGDPGFRFGPAPTGATPGGDVATSWAASRIDLRWDAASKRYLVTTDGRPDIDADGTRHGAATVVVQHVQTTLSTNRDVNGVRTPLATVVGSGQVSVLRDGHSFSGTWTRASPTAPTVFSSGSRVLSMASGPIWVLLVPNGQAVSIS